MILTESITNGALSADYTIVISFSIIGALLLILAGLVSNWLINTLKEIRDSLKDLHKRVETLEDKDIRNDFAISETKARIEEHKDNWEELKKESQVLQREILSKLQQIAIKQ